MQLRKRAWWLVALSVTGMMLTACGKSEYDLRCSVDRDCLESELCHPDEKLCVPRCSTVANCLPPYKLCEPIGPTNSEKICKCPPDGCRGGTNP
ncbi:MAG TPA: hypothetical protein VF794_36905 [Archangium sp.]|jgi:hypothetical protein|uniref:hypothetical protein n=1 Tax=Archangium sp. TaxID=1872627 RepID=UPI002ED85D09